MKKKRIIVIALVLIMFIGLKILVEGRSFASLCNLYQYMELIELYQDIDLNFAEGEDNIYSYFVGVKKNDEGKVEELQILIENLDALEYSQACDVMLATREYMETQEDFPYMITIRFYPVGSGEPYGQIYNHLVNLNNVTLLSNGEDWVIDAHNIIVENCTELYEEYSMFVGYENVYIEDASDYEVLATWEGLERLTAYCGNTQEEIEQYNEALREMFPERYVRIRAR